MTTQILLTRNSRAKFRPLGYRGVLHRHARSGSKVWRIKHQVVKRWLIPFSPTERRGHCISIKYVSHHSEWVKDLTNQVSLTRDSRSLFRPLGYQVIMHRVLHTLSGSKVWCLTNQVLPTSNGRSVFRPLGYQVTIHCIFHARSGSKVWRIIMPRGVEDCKSKCNPVLPNS